MNNYHKEVKGQVIDLISPSFPCNVTEQKEPYTLTCTAFPERSVFVIPILKLHILIEIKLFLFL